MIHKIFLFLLCFLGSLNAFSQDQQNAFHRDTNQENQRELLNKYLTSGSNVDTKINELVYLAQKDESDHQTVEALHKIQIALILEKQLSLPNKTTFELNIYAGDLIRSINKRYALEFYKKATGILKRIQGVSADRKFVLFTNMAGLHDNMMNDDSATFFFHKAMDEAKLDNHFSESSANNNLGVFYFGRNKPDSARIYFQKALNMLGSNSKEINLFCSIKDNLAQLSILTGDFHTAIQTFNYNDSVYAARHQPNRYLINKVRLLESMKPLNASGISGIIEALPAYIDSNSLEIKPEEILKFYNFAYTWYFDHNDRQKEDYYFKRYKTLNTQIQKKSAGDLELLASTLLNVQESSFKNELNAHILSAEKSKMGFKTAKIVAAVSITSALVIIVLLILYMRKRRQEYEINKKITASELKSKEMESRLIQQELELKKRDLTNIVLYNTHVYDANQKMIDRLEDISHQKNNMEQPIRSLLVELQGQNQISERSIGIQAKIESVNAEFYKKLKFRFPELTKAEAELCGFIRINLSSKDISILKNVEASSVKMGKNRLRKKLALDQEADLYDFIMKI